MCELSMEWSQTWDVLLFDGGDLYLLLMNSEFTTGPAFHFHLKSFVVTLYMNISKSGTCKNGIIFNT